MNIKVVCIGKLKERYWIDGLSEYRKRLGKYCELTIDELKEERAPDRPSNAEISMVLEAEGKSILRRIASGDYAIALEVSGKGLSSEELAEKIERLCVDGKNSLVFIIGGSFGLSPDVLARADFKLSFSRMTFPHQMIRVILLEQVYRAFKINRKETYHK